MNDQTGMDKWKAAVAVVRNRVTCSIPGIFYITDASLPKWMRLLWTLVVLALFITLIVVTGILSAVVFSRQKIYSSMMTMATNESLPFPIIHICEQSFFSRQRLIKMGFNDTMSNYLIATQSTLLAAHSFRLDKERNRLMSQSLDELLKPFDGDLYSATMEAALICEEIVVGCVENNTRYNGSYCCATFFSNKKYVNSFGSCISTIHRENHKEMFAVNTRGITFLVKRNYNDAIDLDETIVSPGLSEKLGVVLFSVSHPNAINYHALLYDTHYVTPGTYALVGLSLTMTDNLAMSRSSIFAPYDCVSEREAYPEFFKGFKFYSQPNCELSTIQRVYNEWFECNVPAIPIVNETLPYCLPRNYAAKGNFSAFIARIKTRQKECPKDCTSITYNTQMTEAKLFLSHDGREKYGIKSEDVASVASIHFYFSSLDYITIVHQPERLLTWLGDVGGNMGLYLGLSIITILELITIIWIRFF